MTETMEYSAGRCRFRAWADFWVVSFPERIDTGVIGITDQNCIRKYSHFASRLYASGLGGLDIYAEEHLRLMVNEDNSAILRSEQTLVARIHAHIVGSVWQLAASTPALPAALARRQVSRQQFLLDRTIRINATSSWLL